MRTTRSILWPALATVALLGCTSPASTRDAFLAGTADTAYAVKEGGRTVLWEVPRFVLWTVPKSIVHDLPRSLILAIRGNRARVGAVMGELAAEDLTVEQEVALSAQLRDLTGLPIQGAERWRSWWRANERRPEREWRRSFVEEALAGLASPRYFTRSEAIEDLRALYGRSLDYDPKAVGDELAAGAARWQAFYEEKGLPPRY